MSATEKVKYNVDGKEVDADGVPIGAPPFYANFEVTYNVNGIERWPDGSVVESKPVEKDEIVAGGTHAAAVAERAMLGANGGRPALSPSELAHRAMRDIDRMDHELEGEDVSPEVRAKIAAEILAHHQEQHLSGGASTGAGDTGAVDDDEDDTGDESQSAMQAKNRKRGSTKVDTGVTETNAETGTGSVDNTGGTPETN